MFDGNNLLDEIMIARNLTNVALASLSSIKASSIKPWRYKQKNPNAQALIRLCQTLKVTPNQFYGIDAGFEKELEQDFLLEANTEKLRLNLGISEEEMAAAFGTEKTRYVNTKARQTDYRATTYFDVSKNLGIDLNQFFNFQIKNELGLPIEEVVAQLSQPARVAVYRFAKLLQSDEVFASKLINQLLHQRENVHE